MSNRVRRSKRKLYLLRRSERLEEKRAKRAKKKVWLRAKAKDEAAKKVKRELTDIERARTGRNDPCPCMSGKKYKNCCK